MRLAFFGPLPPAPTGIADYDADVLRVLATRHEVTAFHGQEVVDSATLPAGCATAPAARFGAAHARDPFDATVHQLGNGPEHDFVYEWLARAPGLVVLHDLVLHHARARMFLDSPAARAYAAEPYSAARRAAARGPLEAYAAEVAYSYPRQGQRVAEVHLSTVGHLLPYAYPLFRLPVEGARVVGVHNGAMGAAVAAEVPGARVMPLAMPSHSVDVRPEDVAALRHRLGVEPGDLVVGSFGLMTREKRVETVARAVARATVAVPRLRLLLVGPVPDRAQLDGLLARLAVAARTIVTGRVPLAELPLHMAAADVAVHLRYPTARETSAALLRVLAQGRPAVIPDLENLAEVPDDVAVKVDVADEEGAVTRGLLRLASRPELRDRLGARALEFVRREHSPQRCLETYEAALDATAHAADPPLRPWPPHWAGYRSRTSRKP